MTSFYSLVECFVNSVAEDLTCEHYGPMGIEKLSTSITRCLLLQLPLPMIRSTGPIASPLGSAAMP